MDEYNKKWQNVYEQGVIDNPDMRPSEKVLANILDATFNQERDKHKLVAWMSFFGMSFILVAAILILKDELVNINHDGLAETTQNIVTTTLFQNKSATSAPILENETERAGVNSDAADEDLSLSPARMNDNNTPDSKTNLHVLRGFERKRMEASSKGGQSHSVDSRFFPKYYHLGRQAYATSSINRTMQNNYLLNPLSGNNKFNSGYYVGNSPKENLLETLVIKKTSDVEKKLIERSSIVTKLALPSLNELVFEQYPPALNLSKDVVVTNKVSDWNFEVASDLVRWGETLNNDYSAALDPADFYLEERTGFGIRVQASKELSPKISLVIGGGMHAIRSVSGHNSRISYNIEEEQMTQENVEEMTLGTPYGLLKSEVILRRASDVSVNQDVNMAITSEHSFNGYFVHAALGCKLIEKRRWTLGLYAGPRIYHLSNIKNEVHHQIIEEDRINLKSQKLIANQQHMNNEVIMLFGGLKSEFVITEALSMTGAFEWSEGITSTFKNNNFGSYSQALVFSIGVRSKF